MNNINNINNMNNKEKYDEMIDLIKEDSIIKLSVFVEPWFINRDMPTKISINDNTLYQGEGKYFEFLRWLAFKMIKEKNKDYLNEDTGRLLMFLEENAITGIFYVNPEGQLFNLLEEVPEFKHTSDTITLSNSQLMQYIGNNTKHTGGKYTIKSKTRNRIRKRNKSRKNNQKKNKYR